MVGGSPAGSSIFQHVINPEVRRVWPQLLVGLLRIPDMKISLFCIVDLVTILEQDRKIYAVAYSIINKIFNF